MIEEGIGHPWPEPLNAAVEPFLQGHLIRRPPFFYAADLNNPLWEATRLIAEGIPADERGEDFIDVDEAMRPPFGIITTQSCDLAEERPYPHYPWFAVAPVYVLASDSRLRDRDHIFPLRPPGVDDDGLVADLRVEFPLEKGLLVGRVPIDAFTDEKGYHEFANYLAARRGRPALASVCHELVSTTTRRLKEESNSQRNLARRARQGVFRLMLAIEEGTRLSPVAIKLYVVTEGAPSGDVRDWFDLWWNAARAVAVERGLQLLPVGWMDSRSIDLHLFEDLVELRSPL